MQSHPPLASLRCIQGAGAAAAPAPVAVEDLAGGRELLQRVARLEALLLPAAGSAEALPTLLAAAGLDAGAAAAGSPLPATFGWQATSGKNLTASLSLQSVDPEDMAKCAQDGSMVASGWSVRRRCFDELGAPVVDFSESVYSDFVVTCARGRPWPIFTSGLVLGLCLCAQFMFTSMVATLAHDGVTDLIEQQGPDGKTVNIYRAWREAQGRDGIGNTTLTERQLVCKGTYWSWESDVATNMMDYASTSWLSGNSMPNGKLFGFGSITLWIAYVFLELRSIGAFLCLLSLRTCSAQQPAFMYDHRSGMGQLSGLSPRVRVVVLLLAGIRFILAYMLGYYGVKFLSYTNNLGDFILNSVALLFIHDVDELCFSVFLSREKQHAVRTLQAPRVEGRWSHAIHLMSPFAELMAVLLVAATVLCFSGFLDTYSENYITSAYGQICKGYAS